MWANSFYKPHPITNWNICYVPSKMTHYISLGNKGIGLMYCSVIAAVFSFWAVNSFFMSMLTSIQSER